MCGYREMKIYVYREEEAEQEMKFSVTSKTRSRDISAF
jgi:hypothetical protein